jgi:PadR family transcriptional regulator, regulatory protein PadR
MLSAALTLVAGGVFGSTITFPRIVTAALAIWCSRAMDCPKAARLWGCPRIEQTSGDLLIVNYGTLYPALLKLEQEGYIASEWGVSDNNRKAKFCKLTRAGRKQLEKEARDWEQATAILARFLAPKEQSS